MAGIILFWLLFFKKNSQFQVRTSNLVWCFSEDLAASSFGYEASTLITVFLARMDAVQEYIRHNARYRLSILTHSQNAKESFHL
ncbi:MAG: hypothetical protein ACFFA8_14135 [Promethearchaeota archaeon]